MYKKYNFRADVTGKNILFLGGVHGNETAGTIAQNEIISLIEKGEIKLKSGSVNFIPCVNMMANKMDARYVDENLNRVVRFHDNPITNEQKIANVLIKEISEADIMLDIHSTHCPNDKEFAFIDYPTQDNLELLSLMPVESALAGWPQIYDGNENIENYCTEKYAFENNKTAITIECGFHKSEKAAQIAKKAILNVLSHYDIIDDEVTDVQEQQIIQLLNYEVKKADGKFTKDYAHLTKIAKDEIVAVYDNGEVIKSDIDGYIIMPNHQALIGDEWFYFGVDI